MKPILIIQARIGSSRLRGKILKALGNADVLTYVVERCRKIVDVDEVIVATSSSPQDDVVEEWCKERSVAYYRGSEEDVLDRYVQAAKPFHADYVIRVTADCPFVDYELASEMISMMKMVPADFMKIDGALPRGLAVELFTREALLKIAERGHESRHLEHVTYYAYEYPTEFSWSTIKASAAITFPELRITLDTVEDYDLCKKIADHFVGDLFITSREVVRFLLDNPKIAAINAHIEQKPVE
ncbi:glycosyltransferase family protein [Bacillus sp. Bva_UNVM-123]|uniref:cytidylyltransferase domain-containing protein n=1 Tax=Bacillus sp. Bva_UNVM-123 TaxID=2829798 RepID=UPI00391F8CC6